MKYGIFALIPLAFAADAAVKPQDIQDVVDALGLDIKLPPGLELPEDAKPTAPPADDRTNLYHPPHQGIDIDDCDDDEEEGWHYVHPGQPIYPDQPLHVWTISTVTVVHTSTIIDCPYEIPDCPGKGTLYTTIEIPATTTICPVPVVPNEVYPVPSVSETPETLPVPMVTPSIEIFSVPGHPAPSSSPCPPEAIPSAPVPAYIPPAGPSPSAPYPVHPKPTTLCPEVTTSKPVVVPGTISIPHPPTTPTGIVVTAGAARHVQQVALAVVAGLLVALL